MTPDELLIKRYKCIAPIPFQPFPDMYNVGDIFTDNGKTAVLNQKGDPVYVVEWEKYSHLFQPLPWYAERKPEDMPPYIKRKRSDGTFEILRVLHPSCDRREFGHEDGTIEHRFVFNDGFGGTPATLEEYNEWKQSNK